MLATFAENFFSDFSYVLKLTTVHVNQSRYDVQSIKNSVAVVLLSCAKKSKGHSSKGYSSKGYSLRSNESIFLELPGIKTHPTLGDRAFQSAAPYLWNALPSAIRNMKTLDTFKTAVKTHFFNLAFK